MEYLKDSVGIILILVINTYWVLFGFILWAGALLGYSS